MIPHKPLDGAEGTCDNPIKGSDNNIVRINPLINFIFVVF
jgi:hypothetical protein